MALAMRKALLITAAAMAVVVAALLPATAAWPELHAIGWTVDVDYSNWATQNGPIPAGEALNFVYTEGEHNVVMVDDEGSYTDCMANGQTWNSGNDIVQLPEVGITYYFICSMGDHCDRGMKLAVTAA